MPKKYRALVSLLPVALAGCITASAHSPAPQLKQEVTAPAARVMIDDECPVPAPQTPTGAVAAVPALLIALAPVAVDFSFSVIKDVLQQKKDNLNGEFVATGASALWKDGRLRKCLIIARGRFGPGGIVENDDGQFAPLTKSNMRSTGLTEFPNFYLQMTMDSAGEGGITLTPNLFAYRDTAAVDRGSGTKSIAVLLAIAEQPFVSKGGDTAKKDEVVAGAAARATFTFADRKIGTVYNGLTATAPAENLFADQIRLVSLRQPDRAGSTAVGHNLIAVVSESESSGRMYDIVLKTLSDNEKSIEKAFSDLLSETIKDAFPEKKN